jgi:signal transduction histidine kinase
MELAAISRARSIDQQTASSLDRARLTVEQTLGIVRNIAMLLRPSMLDDLGLVPALNWLVKEVSRSSGMEIRRDIDPEADALPEAHRTCIYRVVQEALTNALKHSGGSVIEVRVKMSEGYVRTWVTDDGRGFQSSLEKRKGAGTPSLGLLGMEERVRELGGELRIHTGPGRGTSLEIVLPHPVGREVSNDQSVARGRSRDRANGVKTVV